MPQRITGELRTKAAWLRLLLACKQQGQTRTRLTREFTVRYGAHEEIIPRGTELVLFWHHTGDKGTTKRFRTEGVFYLADGRTLSIMGYYGRKVPKGREREYRRKTVELKAPPLVGTFDAMRPSRSLVLAEL